MTTGMPSLTDLIVMHPRVSCTSLNISYMKDTGNFRARVLDVTGNGQWLTGTGATSIEAITDLFFVLTKP